MRIVTADFAGAAYPPGTKVSFTTNTDGTLHGTVQGLLPQRARVATPQGMLWKVPYRLLTVVEPTQEPAILLTDIVTLGKRLIREHKDKSGLEAGWQFAFDLAPVRGGSCRYKEKQVTLSVTFCLKASKEEIVDTILHEIAHAIVGSKHGHDATWKTVARQIGCTAERCHNVQHTAPRWYGRCGCGQQWERQRLSQRARTSRCRKCKGNIEWKRVGIDHQTTPTS